MMPSRYTRSISTEDAISEAQILGVNYRIIDIELIRYIKNLLREDCISIKGVQKIFANQSINQILKSKDPILKKKNVLIDNKNLQKEDFKDTNKEYKKIFKEILVDLKNIKNLI